MCFCFIDENFITSIALLLLILLQLLVLLSVSLFCIHISVILATVNTSLLSTYHSIQTLVQSKHNSLFYLKLLGSCMFRSCALIVIGLFV